MFELPDHPEIANALRTGYPDGKEPEELRCPVCGADAEHFYVTRDSRTVVGCEICLIPKPYYEFEAEELS